MIRQLFGLVTLIAVCAALASAQTIYVDGSNPSCPGSGTQADPYCLIQDAVDAASDGDTIEIAPGTYTDNAFWIDLQGKSLSLIGRDGPDDTTLFGLGIASDDVPARIFVEGLTIRGARQGMFFVDCDVTLENCRLLQNQAGGLNAWFCTIDARGCIFSKNDFVRFSGEEFGGGASLKACDSTFTDCLIEDNRAERGGGLELIGGDHTLERCTVRGNVAEMTQSGSGGGGGILQDGESLTIIDCEISDNTARDTLFPSLGGGLLVIQDVFDWENTAVVRTLIAGNSAESGGGIAMADGTRIGLTECRVQGNSASQYGGGLHGSNAYLRVVQCDIDQNEAAVGGGFAVQEGRLDLNTCRVRSNVAFGTDSLWATGGGGYIKMTNPGTCEIVNSQFTENSTTLGSPGCSVAGLSITSFGGSVSLHSVTVTGNTAACTDSAPNELLLFKSGQPALIENSVVWSTSLDPDDVDLTNTLISYSNISGQLYPGEGNLSVDPQFIDPANGDFRLSCTSPCVDTGAPTPFAIVDVEGDPRPVDGDGDGTARQDMGADELYTLARLELQPPSFRFEGYAPPLLENGNQMLIFISAGDGWFEGGIPISLPGANGRTLPLELEPLFLAWLQQPSIISTLTLQGCSGGFTAWAQIPQNAPSGAMGFFSGFTLDAVTGDVVTVLPARRFTLP